MRLSPLDPFAYFGWAGMGLAHLFAGRSDEAVSWARKASQEQPNWATALRVVANAGHWAMYEQPGGFNAAALDLLAQPVRNRLMTG